MKKFFGLVLFLLLSAAVSAFDQGICGQTVTESVVLTEDLDCDGYGIIVGASDITVDCDNHLINGRGDTDSDGTLADEGGYAGVYSSTYDYITVKNCQITNFTYGISLGYPGDGSEYSTISSNTLFDNYLGVMLRYNSNQFNLINGNTITSPNGYTGSGIYLESSNENQLMGNSITGVDYYGIFVGGDYNIAQFNTIENAGGAGFFLYAADYNDLSHNNVFNDVRGFYVRSSSNNQINFNQIKYNAAYGLWFYSQDAIPTESNTAFGNYIQNNNYGVYMTQHNAGGAEGLTAYNKVTSSEVSYNTYGFYLRGYTASANVHDNEISSNNIRSNTDQAYDYASNNLWNNELGGNYWSDYDTSEEGCFDLNQDHVCDAPRAVPVNNTDNIACDIEKSPGTPDNGGCN